jgi:hypothetical protein
MKTIDQLDAIMHGPHALDVTEDTEQVHNGPKYYRDEDGLEWCACDEPKLIHNSGGRGQAKCTDCQRPWFH